MSLRIRSIRSIGAPCSQSVTGCAIVAAKERCSVPAVPDRATAFAPGRVNLIGEHTDYNDGLALPFAITAGVTVRAQAGGARSPDRIAAYARDLGESDEFALANPARAEGWRSYVRGTVPELARAGFPLIGAQLEIAGDVPPGAGLSSSAAL